MPYSQAFRQKMVQKMTGPRARSASQLAAEVGLPQPTLSRWLREATTVETMKRKRKSQSPKKPAAAAPRRPQDWTPAEKLRVVLEASHLGDEELGAFLRREGLREEHLDQWRRDATAALTAPSRQEKKEANKEKLKIRALEREVRRKDKALAETAALLVLQKKLRSIYADEDDDTEPGSER